MTNNNFDIREWRMQQALKEAEFDPKKSDLNRDGELSDYEEKRGKAIAKNIKEDPLVPNPTGPNMSFDAGDLEEDDWKQPDDESDMAKSQLHNLIKDAQRLESMIADGEQLDAWVQAKLTKAQDYINSVHEYLCGEQSTKKHVDIELTERIFNRIKNRM